MTKPWTLGAPCVMLLASLAGPLWGFGSREDGDYKPVTGRENWTHSVDTSDRKEGTYNLIVRAKDRAGNVSYAGPIDIRIDPASDLPRVNVSNPTQGMRVGNNLNILGTCVDDDAVERVEIRVDAREPVVADGREYWSYYLDVADLADGRHTIAVTGIDKNGLASKPFAVAFQLDKRGPALRIDSHRNGVLLNSRAVVSGTAQDNNGIASVSLSRDDRKSWERLKIDLDKTGVSASFRFQIDTTRLEAGPHVYWLRASDKTGSQEPLAFLFFVDNEPPRLQILSPPENAPVAGRLTAVGTVADDVGIKSLEYSVAGGAQGKVELIPGNRYWVQPIDLAGARSTTVTFTAEDLTGNRTKVSRRVSVDVQASLPVVKLAFPAPGSTVTGPAILAGSVRDDEQVKGLEISVDGAAARTVETREAFALDLEPLQPGPHRVAVRGLDAAGMRGAETRVDFVKAPAAPRVDLVSLIVGEESRPFAPGLVVPAAVPARLIASASAGAGALDVSIGSAPARRVAAAERFDIVLAKELAPGRIDITIKAAGAEAPLFRGFVYKGQVTDPPGLILADARVEPNGRANIAEDRPLRLFVAGERAASAEADPRSDRVVVETAGSVVIVSPRAGGSPEQFRVRVTTESGATLLSQPLLVLSDLEPPAITVSEPATGAWAKDSVRLAGSVTDAGGVASLEVSTGGDAYGTLAFVRTPTGATFDQVLTLSGDDGLVVLSVRAHDQAGNQAIARLALSKDTTAPALSVIAPAPGDAVEGTVTVSGQVVEAGVLERVEFSDDGKKFVPVQGGLVFRHDIDLSVYKKVPELFLLRAVDKAGNSATLPLALTVDQSKDRPRAEIQIPEKGAVLRADFVVSGMAFDDDGVRAIVYRLDQGPPARLEAQGAFSIPFALSALADNEHRIEVVAEDLRGVTGEPAVSTFVVSTADPTAVVVEPKAGQTVRGHVLLEGTARDANGIRGIEVSFDNGNTFDRAEGAEKWSYPLNTTLLGDGPHAIQIRVGDKAGVEALYSALLHVDNTPPEMALTSLADGDRVAGSLLLEGRASDAQRLAGLRYRIRPLDGAAGKPQLSAELPPAGVFSQRVDVGALPPGWYNLEVAAIDAAANATALSRNFVVALKGEETSIEVIFPADGEKMTGGFSVDGRIRGGGVQGEIALLLDGAPSATAAATESGFFSVVVPAAKLTDGRHTLAVRATLANGRSLESAPTRVETAAAGPWLSFAEVKSGDYVSGRPWFRGQAGYVEAPGAAEGRERGKRPQITAVELSFDNGRTFVPVKGTQEWRYRLDTSQLVDGELPIIARARCAGGEQAVRRLLVIVDDTPPDLRLAAPAEDTRFNALVAMAGTASDGSGLADVTASLREGGKGRYEVPGFIQGMYLDAHALGATYGEVGFGFTFFDDNVRLQVQAGPSPPGRFSGLVVGTKLIANILSLPFSYFFGPSWDFFSMSFALGANFSYFSMSEESFGFTSQGLMLAAILVQWEMARFAFEGLPMLSFVSLYTEGNLWFISSDISGGTEPRLGFGMRIGLF